MPTEDHPLEYEEFEGVIPEGEYGGGTVIVRDHGSYESLSHDRKGAKLRGEYALGATGTGRRIRAGPARSAVAVRSPRSRRLPGSSERRCPACRIV